MVGEGNFAARPATARGAAPGPVVENRFGRSTDQMKFLGFRGRLGAAIGCRVPAVDTGDSFETRQCERGTSWGTEGLGRSEVGSVE